jgi:TolA-binding protein
VHSAGTHENALAPAPSPEPIAIESAEPSHAPPKASAHTPDRGTLGAETSLLQRALAAERRGNREQTQALLNQLLSKYPSSPLAPEARRALTRVSGSAVEK